MTVPESSLIPVAELSFEDALKELEIVVRRLEEGRQPLEEAITSYERGAALKSRCEELLASARLKVEKIVQSASGETSLEPHDL
mgnify:CR=1 FL=1